MTTRTVLLAALAAGLAASGCCPATRVPDVSTAQPLETVLAGYNANASRVPRLWSHAKVGLVLREKPTDIGLAWGGTSGLHEINARLLLRKGDKPLGPQDFYLVIKEAGQDIGRVGISLADEVYYGWFRVGDRREAYVGQLAQAGAPGGRMVLIDPTQLLGVLGIVEMPSGFETNPLAIQRVLTKPCAYAVTVIDRQVGTRRALPRRVVYFDRLEEYAGTKDGECVYRPRPTRPFRVELLDNRGAVAVTAELSEYETITMDDVPASAAEPPAIMPTRFHFYWHASGTEMNIKLMNMTTEDKVDPEAFEFFQFLPSDVRPVLRSVDEPAGEVGR